MFILFVLSCTLAFIATYCCIYCPYEVSTIGSSLARDLVELCTSYSDQPQLLGMGNGDMPPSLDLKCDNVDTGQANQRGPNWPGQSKNPESNFGPPGPPGYDNPETDDEGNPGGQANNPGQGNPGGQANNPGQANQGGQANANEGQAM